MPALPNTGCAPSRSSLFHKSPLQHCDKVLKVEARLVSAATRGLPPSSISEPHDCRCQRPFLIHGPRPACDATSKRNLNILCDLTSHPFDAGGVLIEHGLQNLFFGMARVHLYFQERRCGEQVRVEVFSFDWHALGSHRGFSAAAVVRTVWRWIMHASVWASALDWKMSNMAASCALDIDADSHDMITVFTHVMGGNHVSRLASKTRP